MPNLERRRAWSAGAARRVPLSRPRRRGGIRGTACAVAWVCLVVVAVQAVASAGPVPAGAATSGALSVSITSYDGDTAGGSPSQSALAGSDVTFQTTVSNAGSSAQANVSVPVSLPASFTLHTGSVAASGGTATPGAGRITWSIPSLASSATATLTYTETADAPASFESAQTSATASSDQSPGTAGTLVAVEVVPASDLTVAVTDGVTAVAPATSDTYTVTLTNAGPSEAPDATLSETFDGAFAAVADGSSDGGATFNDLGGGAFDWTGVDLQAGTSATFTLEGKIPAPLAAGSAFVDVAGVSLEPGEIDTNPASDATDSDVVTGPTTSGTLGVAIASYDGNSVTSTPSESALAGTNVTYRVSITNTSVSAQTDVAVSVSTPPAFVLDSSLLASEGTATGSSGIVWSIPSLGAGTTATLTYTESVDSPAVMTAAGTTAGATSDQSPESAPVGADVEVIPAADLTIGVDDGVETVTPGSTDTQTVTLTNHGPSDVTGASVSVGLSGGFTALYATSSVSGTTFTDFGADQFAWAGINLASGDTATFSMKGSLASSLTAGSAFVDVVTGSSGPGQVDTDASTTAIDTDAVVAAPQAISFTPPALGIAGHSATLSATGGGSGNPVVFSVDPTSEAGVCSVTGTDGTVVDYRQGGTCVIDANQEGNASYAAAPTVTASIPVEQAPAFTADSPPTSVMAGRPYEYRFTALGVPAPTFSLASGAPSWLSIDAVSGALTGTPPAGTSSFSYAVVAANTAGTVTAGPFAVTVTPVTNSRQADVAVALACPATVQVRSVGTCTLSVTDNGPATAKFVKADLVLPRRFHHVRVTGGGRRFGHIVVWFVGALRPDSSASFTVKFRTERAGRRTVVAIAFAANPDPDYANNIATASVVVTR